MDNLPEDILFLFPNYYQNTCDQIKFSNSLLLCCKYFRLVFTKKINNYLSEYKLNLDKLSKKAKISSRTLLTQFIWTITKKSVIPESRKYIPPAKLVYLSLLNKPDSVKKFINLNHRDLWEFHKADCNHHLFDIFILFGYTGNLSLIQRIKWLNPSPEIKYMIYGLLLGGHTEILLSEYQQYLDITSKKFVRFYNSNPKNKILDLIPYTGLIPNNNYTDKIFDPILFLAEINKTKLNLKGKFPIQILIKKNYNFLLENYLVDHGFKYDFNQKYNYLLALCDVNYNFFAYKLLIKYTNLKPCFWKYQLITHNIMLREYFVRNLGILDSISMDIQYIKNQGFSYVAVHAIFAISVGILLGVLIP